MFWFVIGIIVTIAAFVFFGLRFEDIGDRYNPHVECSWKWSTRQLFALCGLIICLFGCVTKVPANHVGIVYSPFGGTQNETLAEGFNTKSPFDTVYKISTEVQTERVENLTTQTKDAQYVTTIIDIKYRVNASDAFLIFKQYRTLENMSDNLIMPSTQRVLELVTTRYNVIDILGEKRSAIYAELDSALAEEFAKYGVEFVSISIIDMDAGDELEAAITAEAVAKKEVETAEQNLLKAEMEAKQKSVEAQAEQDAARIEAETRVIEAEAEKKANELLSQSLTEDILQKQWIEKWNGEMPTYYGGSGEIGFMMNGNS